MKNIFELADEERILKEFRIKQAFCGGAPRGVSKAERQIIAKHLYEARWDGNAYHEADNVTADEILGNFCWQIFGASLDEVMKAWDRYLG